MSELILVGDRVLIDPQDGERQTQAGLYLPVTVTERDRVRTGRVVRVGPGYLLPNPDFSEAEPWTRTHTAGRYLPLEARPGDYAFFLRKEAIEITYEQRTYVIVHHSAILALIRTNPDEILGEIEGLMQAE